MIRRTYALSILMAMFGLVVLVFGHMNTRPVDEKWLEKTYPMSVGNFRMVPGQDNPMQSYRMDENTYRELDPFGIVSRILSDGHHSYDVVVISSNERDSFHNPLACFTTQEWKIQETHEIKIPTKSRGMVAATLAHAEKGGMMHIAVYTYEGPSAMHPVVPELHNDLLLSELKTARPQFGTFFRFVSQDANVPDDEVIKFAADYLDASPVRPVIAMLGWPGSK